jgi:hypothetical protein
MVAAAAAQPDRGRRAVASRLSEAWPQVTAILAAWAACFSHSTAPYRWTHEQWWFLRFLLPAAPALIVAGLLVTRHLLEKAAGRLPDYARRALPALVLAVAVAVELDQTSPLREARAVGHGELKYGRVSKWLAAHVPGNSAIVVSQVSGALFYFTDYTLLRHDQIGPAVSKRILASLQAEGRPLYAVLFPFEADALKKLPGTWTRVGALESEAAAAVGWAQWRGTKGHDRRPRDPGGHRGARVHSYQWC